MKSLRIYLFTVCVLVVVAAAAQNPDPVIASIDEAYAEAKAMIKKNAKSDGCMTSTINYYVPGQGRTTETLNFYSRTVRGNYLMVDEDSEPHFHYYPLYFVTRDYNIGKKKYHEEFLYDSKTERPIFALTQDYDEQGKRFDRRFYFQGSSVYTMLGPEPTANTDMLVYYWAEELKHGFDDLMRNPKE